MVATAAPQATDAALQILRRGGNAVDAAIAAQWVLNVVEPQSSGIGGGAFFLYYEKRTGRIYSFDGRETAPAEAFPEMFLNELGRPYPFRPDRITGGLPVGVPGVLKLLHQMHHKFGSKNFSFDSLFQPAIQIAEKGFPVSERLAHFIDKEKERLRIFKASRLLYFDEEKNPLPENAILFQYDLARTFRKIQEEGIEVFYEGDIASAIVQAVRTAPFHPGYLKLADLKEYKVKERTVLRGSYRGYDIYSMGPPSSGGSTLIETLNILEQFDLNYYQAKTDRYHLMAEAQYLAFQDRNQYLGDPEFTKIPLEKLTSKSYAQDRSSEVQVAYSLTSPPVQLRNSLLEGTHTSQISIVDTYGNMVSMTTTIEEVFGSAMVVPGWGIVLNNELTDFEATSRNQTKDLSPKSKVKKNEHRLSEREGKSIVYGLSSRVFPLHPNAPEGDKRPRSSMTPTFVFDQGRPFLIVGSPGGSTIIGTVLNIIVNMIDFRLNLQEAIRAPKILNREGILELEPPLFQNENLKKALLKRGHQIQKIDFFGNAQAVHFDEYHDRIVGESDPRGDGKASGY